ncbi:hypothetical protein DCE94_02985 [Agromyces badenianii]|nr:hypothetical protein DCE94_02985 [Agromyces badenianii]
MPASRSSNDETPSTHCTRSYPVGSQVVTSATCRRSCGIRSPARSRAIATSGSERSTASTTPPGPTSSAAGSAAAPSPQQASSTSSSNRGCALATAAVEIGFHSTSSSSLNAAAMAADAPARSGSPNLSPIRPFWPRSARIGRIPMVAAGIRCRTQAIESRTVHTGTTQLTIESRRPAMTRALRRAAPIALASAAALLLAGCSGGPDPEASETPSAAACMEVESGELSDGVTVEGEFAGSPSATFTTPLEADELERTIAIEGDGDTTAAGDPMNVVVTAFSGASGETLFSQPTTIKVGDEQVFESFRAGIDCVPVGSRTVTVAPAATLYGDTGNETIGVAAGETVVIVIDVVEEQEPLEPAEWTEDVPEVKFGAEGEAPTVTLPDTEPSTELQMKVLEEGDGAEVQTGDSVTVQYQGTSWNTGEIFDQSYGGNPATFTTDGVIQGFGAALVGQKVGTKLIVTIPPEYAYGTDAGSHELGGQTLVFLVEIESTEAAE